MTSSVAAFEAAVRAKSSNCDWIIENQKKETKCK